MPGFYVIAGCKQEDDMLRSTVLSTCSVGYVQSFQWDRPINGFDIPMDCLTQLPGTIETDYDGMVALLSANGNRNWWIAKIHANYKNDLDMYIRFGLLPGRVYHYWLIVPQKYYEGRSTTDENGVYADPRLWYYAEKKIFQKSYSEEEFEDYLQNHCGGYKAVDESIDKADPIDKADSSPAKRHKVGSM